MTDYPTFGNKPLQHIPYTTRTTSIRTKPTDGRAKKSNHRAEPIAYDNNIF